MKKQHCIWICVAGGVMGFSPEEILEFEQEYHRHMEPVGISYWNGFNLYYEYLLGASEATDFSELWRDDVAMMQLNRLRAACHSVM